MKRGYQAPKDVRPFTKKKKKPLHPSKIKPINYDDDIDRDSTQTPVTGLPASFIPAPFSGGYGIGLGSVKGFTKHAKDQIPGGLADDKSPEDFDSEALEEGIKIELEHTSSKEIAEEIAMDHLTEDPEYYKKLKTIESKIKGFTKKAQWQEGTGEEWKGADDLNQMFKFERLKGLTKQAEKLTYGFDVDEVLCDIHTPILEIAREYIDIPDDIAWKYKKLKDMPGAGKDIQDKVFGRLTTEVLANMPALPGAVEKVNAIHDAGHRVVIITARKKGWDEGTKQWLDNVGIKYDKLITDSGDDKGKYAAEEGVDIFFDDTVKHLEEVANRGIKVYRFDTPWEDDDQFPVVSGWDQVKIAHLIKEAAPRWTDHQEERLKCLYKKWRARGYPHHAIYEAAGQLLGRSFLSVKQKLESMYCTDEELAPMKYEHWDQGKIDTTIQDLYRGGDPVSRLDLPSILMYQITNHSYPKADTRGFQMFYDSFDHAMAQNILTVGFERDGSTMLEDRPITTLEQALQYYRRKEKKAHNWSKDEVVALFRDAHAAGLPLTHSFFKSHPDIYKPLLGLGRSLEGLKDSIRRNGYDWSDLVVEAAPEYAGLYSDSGRLTHSTEEMRIRRFLELNEIPFRVATIQDKYEVNIPELQKMGYRNFVPDFFILDKEGNTAAIVEVFGSVADSDAANTSELYREKKIAKEQFYQTLPYDFIWINNNKDGVDLTDEILQTKFHRFIQERKGEKCRNTT